MLAKRPALTKTLRRRPAGRLALSPADDATLRGLVLAAAILKNPSKSDQLVRRWARAYLGR